MTHKFTKSEVVTLALHQCGGAHTPVDTEDVAMAAYKLSPGRFAWQKFRDQINLELVRVCLSNAKKAKNGGLVVGTGSKGWSLSSAGARWVAENGGNLSTLGDRLPRSASKNKSPQEQRWRRERARIIGTLAHESWLNRKPIDMNAASEVFRIDSYSDGDLIQRKIARIIDLFGNDELEEFLLKASNTILEQQK